MAERSKALTFLSWTGVVWVRIPLETYFHFEFLSPSPFRTGQRSRCKWNQACPFTWSHSWFRSIIQLSHKALYILTCNIALTSKWGPSLQRCNTVKLIFRYWYHKYLPYFVRGYTRHILFGDKKCICMHAHLTSRHGHSGAKMYVLVVGQLLFYELYRDLLWEGTLFSSAWWGRPLFCSPRGLPENLEVNWMFSENWAAD